MKKNMHGVNIGLVILMVGLLMTVSACSKKRSQLDPMESGSGISGSGAASQSLTEEELEAQRLREAEAARMEAAKTQLVDEDVYFRFDDATLSEEARQVLLQKVAWLRDNSGVSVLIEGHCDERGTSEYNIALGQRRAESVKMFMVDAGISASRLNTISYGEEQPIDSGKTESAWAKNRRAHFRIQN